MIGAVVDIDLLREVLPDLSEPDVLDAVDVLLPRRVFRETGNPGQVEFVHDLLRELPYADLSATRRQSLHRRVGERLESRRATGKTVAAAVLAEHFRVAEDRTKAFTYTMAAAEAALEAYAFTNAIGQLNQAKQLLPGEADARTQYRLYRLLGQASGCSGRADEAIKAHSQALAHAGDRIERGNSQIGIGENYLRKGNFEYALLHLDSALKEAGFPRPETPVGILLDTARSAFIAHCQPRWLNWTNRGQDKLHRIDLAFAVNHLRAQLFSTCNVFKYANCAYKLIRFARISRKPEHIAVAFAGLGMNLAFMGVHGPVKAQLRVALKAIEGHPHDEIWARTIATIGSAHSAAGRLNEGETMLLEALEMLDKIADYYTNFTHHLLRHLYAVRGNIALEIAEGDAEIALGKSRGDEEALAWGTFGKANALARSGQTDEALDLARHAVEILHPRKSMAEAVARTVMGFAHIQASDYASSRRELLEAARLVRVNFYLLEVVGPAFPLLVESLLGPRWAQSEDGPDGSTANRAWRESRFTRFAGWWFRNYRSHALRVSGRAAFAVGKKKRAAEFFEKAITSAEKLGARYDLARAYLDASLVIPEKSDEYRKRGLDLLHELGAVVPEAEMRAFL